MDAAKLVLASGNAGKLAELRDLLADSGFDVARAIANSASPTPTKPACTFVENALLKARHAARATGLPALGDDSGLCVDALGGAPGLYSARYAGAPRRCAGEHRQAARRAAATCRTRNAPRTSTPSSCCCATPTIRSRSSPKAAGTAASCMRRAATAVSVHPQ